MSSSDSPPSDFSDVLYYSLCQDACEAASAKGQQAFRDFVFDKCSQHNIILPNCRMGANGVLALSQLLKGEPFGRLVRLDLFANQVANYGVFELLKAITANNQNSLKYLNLGYNNIGNKGCVELSKYISSPSCALVALELGNAAPPSSNNAVNNITAQINTVNLSAPGSAALPASSPTAAQSSSVSSSLDSSLKPNHIDSKAAAKLLYALNDNRTLNYLGLKSNDIGKKDQALVAATLAHTLMKNTSLTCLVLEATGLGARGAAAVVGALSNHNNENSSNNAPPSKPIASLIPFPHMLSGLQLSPLHSLHNKTLRALNLSSNAIDASIGPLLQSLLITNNTLCSLKLSHNPLNESGPSTQPSAMEYLCEGLRHNENLLVLDLDNTNVGDAGALKLASIFAHNRTLTSLNLSSNNISESAGRPLLTALITNPVLTHLALNNNPLKNAAILALAESLISNRALQSLELNSCKISDDGLVAIVSAIGNNGETVLKTLKARDNYISANMGEFILDALYRNTTLCTADFRGNQLDHTKLNKIQAICKRNLGEIKDAEPRKLKKEIARLRGEQTKLRKAEQTLGLYEQSIQEIQGQIATIENEKANFLRLQQERRAEIRAQIEKEKAAIKESQSKLEEKKGELSAIEGQYQDRLNELNKALQREIETRKATESELSALKRQLEETIKDKPNKVQELKDAIEAIKNEKTHYQQQLMNIRKELNQLQSDYEAGQPIVPLIEQAKQLLLSYQTQNKERAASATSVAIEQAAKLIKPTALTVADSAATSTLTSPAASAVAFTPLPPSSARPSALAAAAATPRQAKAPLSTKAKKNTAKTPKNSE